MRITVPYHDSDHLSVEISVTPAGGVKCPNGGKHRCAEDDHTPGRWWCIDCRREIPRTPGPTPDGVPCWPRSPDGCEHPEFVFVAEGPAIYGLGEWLCSMCGTPERALEVSPQTALEAFIGGC